MAIEIPNNADYLFFVTVNVNPLNLVASTGGNVDFIFNMEKPCPFKVFKGRELTDGYVVYNSKISPSKLKKKITKTGAHKRSDKSMSIGKMYSSCGVV